MHNLPLTGICKGIFCTGSDKFLKYFVHKQNRAFVPTYTFRMKSTESFINEAPWVCLKQSSEYFHTKSIFAVLPLA